MKSNAPIWVLLALFIFVPKSLIHFERIPYLDSVVFIIEGILGLTFMIIFWLKSIKPEDPLIVRVLLLIRSFCVVILLVGLLTMMGRSDLTFPNLMLISMIATVLSGLGILITSILIHPYRPEISKKNANH